MSDVVQMHLDLSGAFSFGWVNGLVDDDLLHKGMDHIVCQFCAVPVFSGKGEILVSLCVDRLRLVQPVLNIRKFEFQSSFLLLVLRRQLVETFLRDMPQSIILV